jgi:hypothetical protein
VPTEETDLPSSDDAGNIIALLEQETALSVDQYCEADIAVPRNLGTSLNAAPSSVCHSLCGPTNGHLGQQVKRVPITQVRNQKQ